MQHTTDAKIQWLGSSSVAMLAMLAVVVEPPQREMCDGYSPSDGVRRVQAYGQVAPKLS